MNNLSIDFGTCNTVISYKTDGNIMHILDDVSGDMLIPSTILFLKDEITPDMNIRNLEYARHFIIGGSAKELANSQTNAASYFYQFKRFLGLTSKSSASVNDFINKFNLKYELDEDTIYFFIPTQDDNTFIKINIIDLTRLYFLALHTIIKQTLNIIGDINIILTCPAYFHDLQRTQLKKAAENASFIVYKMYNEPTAAAVYYIQTFNELVNMSNKFIVYDLGGGTIDTTVIEYHLDSKICDIIDIDGNNSLGGIDIDNILISDIYNKYQIDKNNMKIFNKIRKCAEEIKIKLSFSGSHEVVLENVPIYKQNNILEIKDILVIKYTTHVFNSLINELVDRMIEPIIRMCAKYSTTNIIFIGGPTQIPLLQTKVSAKLNINSNNIILNNKNNLYKTIVADGATTLYDLLNAKSEFCLLDIIPMNIGISSPDNQMIVMVNKNSKIPISVERVFSTSHDCQRSIDIEIFEGIEILCSSNSFIGSYKIIGIPPLPRGAIIIKLLFKISYNGILNISINGFKNPSDDSAKSFDFKLCEKIKLIPSILAKELLRKLLNKNIMSEKI